MANIVIIGAGVMGSALAVPAAASADNQVTLVGSPLDDHIISVVQENRYHPTLEVALPTEIDVLHLNQLSSETLQAADIVILGVSSAGIPWIVEFLTSRNVKPSVLGLVTKGLVASGDNQLAPLSYADVLDASMTTPAGRIVGIAGPCIARELALKIPTRVTFGAHDSAASTRLKQLLQTDYYRITTHSNIVALEACAALKNFLCIGVSAMFTAYPLNDSHAKNPLAALYNQAVRELFVLSQWISDSSPTLRYPGDHIADHVAFDLAGMGDLHVTVGGGRNSRLGRYLGSGEVLSQVLLGPMNNVTVEGVDTGRNLMKGFRMACSNGTLDITKLPLTNTLLDCIEHDTPFSFDFSALPE